MPSGSSCLSRYLYVYCLGRELVSQFPDFKVPSTAQPPDRIRWESSFEVLCLRWVPTVSAFKDVSVCLSVCLSVCVICRSVGLSGWLAGGHHTDSRQSSCSRCLLYSSLLYIYLFYFLSAVLVVVVVVVVFVLLCS